MAINTKFIDTDDILVYFQKFLVNIPSLSTGCIIFYVPPRNYVSSYSSYSCCLSTSIGIYIN